MGYSIVEPVPTARPNAYMHCGRGGAGNMYKPSSNSSTSSSAPLRQTNTQKSTSSTSSTGNFVSGRGGAGNIRPRKEVEQFSFDEELTMQMTRDQNASVWHVGRGGAGNWTRSQPTGDALDRKISGESSASDSSSRSANILGRISSVFARA